MGGGGGGGPTSSTVTQSNIPDWLRPQVEGLLGGATKQFFNTKEVPGAIDPATGKAGPSTYDIVGTKPFTPYSSDPSKYVAGFSPLQQQVQYNAANLQMPGQFNQATGYANAAAQGGLGTANQAAGYGNAGFQSGQMGQALGMQAAQQAAQRAAMGEQAAYGYGNMGVQAGLQGQQSGLLGQQIGTQGGQYYGGMGAGYGQQGAGLANSAMGYGGMGAGYGSQAANLANTALGYGQRASTIGDMALQAQQTGQGITAQSQRFADQQALAGQNYANQMTSPSAVQQYMNPYQSAVTDVQLQGLQRQADIAAQGRKSAAARAGAFGGSRQAIENAEANRALASQMDAIRAQGQQAAYDKAVQAMQYGSNLGLQGLSGAQSGLGTALQGGQLGLSGIGQALAGQQGALSGVGQAGAMYGLGMQGAQSGLAGVNAANQAYQTGIQGAGMGLQGVNAQLAGTAQGMQGAQSAMQGAGVGLSGVDRALASGQLALSGTDRGLAGTAQGMQGAQVGLQGVSGQQAGYGLANTAASNLANIGTQQLGAQTGILGLQNQIGGQQQAQEQQIINNAINNYAQAQQAPLQNFNNFNALLRGYAVPGQTSTQYQAAPSLTSQIVGGGTALLAGNQLLKSKAGGHIKRNMQRADGLDTLGMYNAMRGLA
jgi:hypothetical protein